MAEIPLLEHQRLSNNISTIIYREAVSSKPTKLLSDRDDKKVEVIKGTNGRSVRRTYDKKAIDYIQEAGMSFRGAWDGMHSDFESAGLSIVPSFIVEDPENDESVTVISMYLDDARPVREATIHAKKDLALSLGRLAHSSRIVFPRLEMFQPDTFQKAKKAFGDEMIVMTDVDPYVSNKDLMLQDPEYADIATGNYIEKVALLFWSNWSKESERESVLGSLALGLAPILADAGKRVQKAFGKVNLMKQGIPPHDL